MKRLNNLFIILFISIGILSIAYIWKSENIRGDLELKIVEQSQDIESLNNNITELKKTKSDPENVKGAATAIGTVTGVIQFNSLENLKTTITCAQDKTSNKEFCTDELIKTSSSKKFEYVLEIPKGEYFIYVISPPDSKKTYHSKTKKCEKDICEKILLEIIEKETLENINLYF